MTEIAICFYGHIRTWDLCKENFTKNVLESLYPIIPDIFVHTYDKNDIISDIIYTEDEINKMITFRMNSGETIVPKIVIVEDNDQVQEQNKIESRCLWEKGDPDGTTKAYSIVKKIKHSHQLMKDYEIMNNIKYKYIMITRFDMTFKEPAFLPGFLSSIKDDFIYNFYSGAPEPCDEIVIGTSKMIEIFVSRYEQIYKVGT
jgi:hypothetical protein